MLGTPECLDMANNLGSSSSLSVFQMIPQADFVSLIMLDINPSLHSRPSQSLL